MEKSEIPEILNFMNALYPNRRLQINTITISVWYEMLKDFKKEDVKNAIKDIANSQQYIPNLPEIVKRIQPLFTFEIDHFGNTYAVYVRYPDSMFPFRFKNRDTANKFINMLRTKKPDIEVIKDLHCKHLLVRKGILKEEEKAR